ncbi:MAG: hypothetical protein ACI9TH_003361 [Kiritimatiellia bacterium]|jgi:uncharacterized protein YbbC (DUF1343 family)
MYLTGLDRIDEHLDILRGRRLALLAHPASLNQQGEHAAAVLARHPDLSLCTLFGPEHGFFGQGDAGEKISDARHPLFDIPVISLYGEHRKPSPEMLADIDTIVVDLQDLAVRCYTFCTSLRYVLEAASEAGISVVVLDRPIPLGDTLDGPVTQSGFDSFVSGIEAPLVYGMTPGETASWLKHSLSLDVQLDIIPMAGYRRAPAHLQAGAPWVPPSPGIRSWQTAYIYPVTVFTEALPRLFCDRAGTLPFQLLLCKDICGRELVERVQLPGVQFHPDWRFIDNTLVEGIRIVPTDLDRFKPVATAVHLLHAIQQLIGVDTWWTQDGIREDFFDLLMGTDEVRRSLKSNESPEMIVKSWECSIQSFRQTREGHLLYG